MRELNIPIRQVHVAFLVEMEFCIVFTRSRRAVNRFTIMMFTETVVLQVKERFYPMSLSISIAANCAMWHEFHWIPCTYTYTLACYRGEKIGRH